MRVADMMKPDGRVFLKSEFGPISDDWPCFSFSKKNLAANLQADYKPGRDIIIYVGTSSNEKTKNPDHRSRILSAISIEPSQVIDTRNIVPEDSWNSTVAEYGEGHWEHSMAVTKASQMMGVPFPKAHDVIPDAYRKLSDMKNRGLVVEILDTERDAIMALPIVPVELKFTDRVKDYLYLKKSVSPDLDTSIKQEVLRMTNLILARVRLSGTNEIVKNPARKSSDLSVLHSLIMQKWENQKGKCALCNGDMLETNNEMLKPSVDRIDSNNCNYNEENIQVAHFACNLAKNQYTCINFNEWLSLIKTS